MKPRVFIASSLESIDVANKIQRALDHQTEVTVWDQGIFDLNGNTLDSLTNASKSFDFAVFVFSPDDIVKLRGDTMSMTRVKVLFKLGLFTGTLGRKRCFIVRPRHTENYRFPTDLLGTTCTSYEPNRSDGNLYAAVKVPCDEILDAIKKIWFLSSSTKDTIQATDSPSPWAEDELPSSVIDHPPPLTLVLGDRRERPPKTPGDFFAKAASSRDITWLLSVGFHSKTMIWNDKIISATEDDRGIPEYVRGSNLIIIGSPLCNLMARKVNKSCFFRLNIEDDVIDDITDEETNIRGKARNAPELADHFHSLDNRHDMLVHRLGGIGFTDVIQQEAHAGARTNNDTDFASVSLCKHPYSASHHAIYVAGLHLPGTMAAVRILGKPSFFDRRPFGGILKIGIPPGGWHERLTRATCEWFTAEYTVDELKRQFTQPNRLIKRGTFDDKDLSDFTNQINDYKAFRLSEFLSTVLLRGVYA